MLMIIVVIECVLYENANLKCNFKKAKYCKTFLDCSFTFELSTKEFGVYNTKNKSFGGMLGDIQNGVSQDL